MATLKRKNADGTWEYIQLFGKDLTKSLITKQDTPPTDATVGDMWLDTSIDTYQGTVFSDINGQLNDNTTKLTNATRNKINVINKGADPTGVTNAVQSFKDAITEAESKITSNATIFSSNNEGNAIIDLPAGTFIITDDNPQLLSSTTARTRGLVIRGAGRGVTKVLFKPTNSNGYLFYNNDKWLHVHFEGISFIGDFTKNTNFMYSYSTGGAQNYSFDKCDFTDFNYGFKLEGNNTNSEMSWFHCGFYGSWNKVLYADAATGSDQFLNYDFFKCQFEAQQGDFIHLEKGGNVNIWGGSFIHLSSTAGTFFKLYGNSHAYGVQRFLCIGSRVEHRFTTSMLVDCQWNDGTVSFISVDTSSQTGITGANTMTTAQFTSVNQKMPNIKFDNCSLMGQHKYPWGSSSYQFPHNIVYENCEITNFNKPSDFIVIPTGSSNWGGEPAIKFRNCRGLSDNQSMVWDTVINWHQTMTGVTQKKIVNMFNLNGGLPVTGQTIDLYLPMNSVITNVMLFSPSGGTASTASSSFTVQTTEATPTVLGTVSFANYSTGFNYSNPQFFPCKSDTTRHIQLVSGANLTGGGNANGYCLIEYI